MPRFDRGITRWPLLTAGLLIAPGAAGHAAVAHEEGVLRLARREFAAGDSLPIAGEKFSRNSRLSLSLVGVEGRIALSDVQVDTAGTFRAALLVPATVAPGAYRLVALADDGDEVASLDVKVSAATAEHASMPGHETMEMDEPSNEPLALERARSPLVTWSVVAGIGLAVVAGAVLLRRPASGGR